MLLNLVIPRPVLHPAGKTLAFRPKTLLPAAPIAPIARRPGAAAAAAHSCGMKQLYFKSRYCN